MNNDTELDWDNYKPLGVMLLDMEIYFRVFDEYPSNDCTIYYGVFAVALVNTDYNKIRKGIIEVIDSYFSKGFDVMNLEKFATRLYHKIYILISFGAVGYVSNEVSYMIANILTREIVKKIVLDNNFVITDIEQCMPIVFSNPQIINYVKNILERKSDDLTPIIQATGVFKIESEFTRLLTYVYYPSSSADYLMIDLKMYLERSKYTLKECERCGRLFVPTRKSDKYCKLFSINEYPKTCDKIMHISPNDEFIKARNKARDKQHKQIKYYKDKGMYEHNFLYNLYDNWSDECSEKCTEFKAKGDIEGFKNWIEETKFSKERLLFLYKNEIDKTGENE